MKKILLFSILAASMGAYAQDEVITYTDDAIVVDLHKACWNNGKIDKCDLNQYGIDAVLTAASSNKSSEGVYAYYDIESRISIKRMEYKCLSTYSSYYQCAAWSGARLSGNEYKSTSTFTKTFDGNGVNKIELRPDYHHSYQKLHFNNGIPTSLNASLSSAVAILRSSYQGVKFNLDSFKNEIARSHRGHLARFTEALEEGIKLTSAKDAKTGRPLYSILNWRIQENARLIVVFGTVLNELLTDYDDVNRLKTAIAAMRTLVEQLRVSYDWQNGLAGNTSKASSSLLSVVKLELQELVMIKGAFSDGNTKAYTDLIRIVNSLIAKVDASRSGDMKAQREIFALVDAWNAKPWQDELNSLMNAGPDFRNLVIPKLSMLIFAVESVADLTEQDFILPDRSTIK